MDKTKLIILFIIMVMVGGGLEWGKARWRWLSHSSRATNPITAEEQQPNLSSAADAPRIIVSPNHKQILAQPPETIDISFEFPVTQVKVSLRKGEEDFKNEPPEFSEDGKTLSFPFPRNAGGGTYILNYNLCSESEKCVNGFSEFTVE